MIKNKNKLLSVILSILLISSLTVVSFAKSNNNDLLFDPEEVAIEMIEPTKKIHQDVISESSMDNSQGVDIDLIFKNVKNLLNSYGISINKFDNKISKISSPKNDSIYYKLVFDGENCVDVDSGGNIIRIKILSENTYMTVSHNVKNKIINDIESRGYKLVREGYIDIENAILSMEFQKPSINNIYNPYESVSVVIDEKNNCLHGLNVRDNKFISKKPIISKENVTKKLFTRNEKIDNCELVIIKPKDYTTDNSDSSLKLAYVIEDKSGFHYIDANNGNYIGSSSKQSKSGKSFSITTNWNGRYIGNMGHDGLSKLGYNMHAKYISSSFGNQLKVFLKSSGSEKGIFVNCHGNPDVLSDNKNWYLYRSELNSINAYNKKCRFAYFNSCKGAYNTGWARSLGIKPGEWGAFVGWSIDVDQAKGVLFAERFWRYANGRRPILKAVELGSNDMPSSYYIKDGQGIYPDNTTISISSPLGIRFIGNKTFYGNGN